MRAKGAKGPKKHFSGTTHGGKDLGGTPVNSATKPHNALMIYHTRRKKKEKIRPSGVAEGTCPRESVPLATGWGAF